eukprot:GHRQ01000979.1.p1 GENE.GHRQ01000979.1~~GHRQ01000979.1.p1  ORF type:complete len:416 (+),score=162.30 GHRQ01000979.1:201-1448(+)
MIYNSALLLALQGLGASSMLGSCRAVAAALHTAARHVSTKPPRSPCDTLLAGVTGAAQGARASSTTTGDGSFVAQGNKIGWLAGSSGWPAGPHRQQPLPGTGVVFNAPFLRGSARGIFGVAKPAEPEEAHPSAPAVGETPLDLDIGGEGGYFDHDEAHSGLQEREAIAALFDRWNEALATKNPAAVADMYGHDAVLLPTVSNEVRTTRAGIMDYFSTFLKMAPQGKVDQSTIRLLSPDVALHSGVYSFTLNPAEGETKLVQARFTFLYRKYNGRWLIAEHHSSAMPEQKPAGVEEMFDKWNAALQTGNPEIVADLYAPDGVLLPTVSNQVRTCRQGIVDYFSNFLKLKPYGTINKSVVREVSPGVAINSGVYTFKLTTPESGEVRDVRARYTFIYKQFDGKWFIAEHHSSAMPEA